VLVRTQTIQFYRRRVNIISMFCPLKYSKSIGSLLILKQSVESVFVRVRYTDEFSPALFSVTHTHGYCIIMCVPVSVYIVSNTIQCNSVFNNAKCRNGRSEYCVCERMFVYRGSVILCYVTLKLYCELSNCHCIALLICVTVVVFTSLVR
jgi:hypothetical protein